MTLLIVKEIDRLCENQTLQNGEFNFSEMIHSG